MFFLGLRIGVNVNGNQQKENIKITDEGFLIVKYFVINKKDTDLCVYKVKVLQNIAKCFKKLLELTKRKNLFFNLNLPDE